MKCCGYYIGTVRYGDAVANICLYVVKQDVETFLSGRLSEELGIIKFNQSPRKVIRKVDIKDTFKASIMSQYPAVFTGVGTLKSNKKVKLHIDSSIPTVAEPVRPVPFHLRERFLKEIETMEEQNIIEEHEPPVSNPVLAPKDNRGIRITVDMRQANKTIESTNVPIPRVEDIQSQLAGNEVFSKLDFKSAFHQLELEEESRNITVFHAGNRLIKYRKLSMGTKPASGELAKALTPLFQHIPGAHVIQDDVIIAGKDKI